MIESARNPVRFHAGAIEGNHLEFDRRRTGSDAREVGLKFSPGIAEETGVVGTRGGKNCPDSQDIVQASLDIGRELAMMAVV